MTVQDPKTFIVVIVRFANNVICQKEWKREIRIGNGPYGPFHQQRTNKDLQPDDPYKNFTGYYDEVFVRRGRDQFSFSLKVTPPIPDSYYWPVEGQFRYRGRGRGIEAVQITPASFRYDIYPDRPNDNDTLRFNIYVSMIRDSTARALAVIRSPADYRYIEQWTWQKRPKAVIGQMPEGVYFTGSPPVREVPPRINVARTRIAPGLPDTTDMVFELRERVETPRLLAVSWPNAIDPSAGPVPILVYFHPFLGQTPARQYYQGESYPWGWKYIHNVLWQNQVIKTDPLLFEQYYMGMPYQMMIAGKKAVFVVPCNKLLPNETSPKELGLIIDAKWMNWLLFEICAFMSRKRNNFSQPVVGRVGIAAFSVAYQALCLFLDRNAQSDFVKNKLSEVFFFDPPTFPRDCPDVCVRSSTRWADANRNPGDPKRIRFYRQEFHPAMARLVGRFGPEWSRGRSVVADSQDGSRTSGLLLIPDWQQAYEYAMLRRWPRERVVHEGGAVFWGETQMDLTACLNGRLSGDVIWSSSDGTLQEIVSIANARNVTIDKATFPTGDGNYFDAQRPRVVAFKIYTRKKYNYFVVHETIPAMMLTDAMRKSGFS